ncbi:reverse transcriptase domain-containing protein [Tanacetum coccineum]|uniref:Reverse transcriptase domain-containing protein n=1 Tax=Tanacetum coccineum TaxID=301880 RepID=A0ABQ4YRY6_9ASTR
MNQASNQSSTDDLIRQYIMKQETLNLNHETRFRNQEATFLFMHNQMGQMAKILQERPRGVLPSNTVPNLREQINSITTRSELTTAEPSIPPPIPPTPREEVFSQCPEKLGDPRKFLIHFALQDLEVCNSLADSGASINLMPLSIYEKLGTGPLKPTRMTRELANRSVIYPMGIAKNVIVKVDKFNFLADFIIVDFEADSRVPIILGRTFLCTTKALIDLYEEKLTIRIGNEDTTSHSDLSLPNYKSFFFDIGHQEEKSSGSTTSKSNHSLPDYEAFCFEEKSSCSTTSHSDPSLLEYESFYFDLSIDTLPPADRSDYHHEEFADELAHIISPPEYDHFYFDIKEFSEIDFLVSFPSRNKDKSFNPEIFIIKGVYSKRSHIHPLNDFSPISFVSDLLLTNPSEIETFLSFPSENEDKVFYPWILLINGVLSFTIKSPHLLNDNFKIDKRHISSEASLKIKSLICFHPKDKEIRGR